MAGDLHGALELGDGAGVRLEGPAQPEPGGYAKMSVGRFHRWIVSVVGKVRP